MDETTRVRIAVGAGLALLIAGAAALLIAQPWAFDEEDRRHMALTWDGDRPGDRRDPGPVRFVLEVREMGWDQAGEAVTLRASAPSIEGSDLSLTLRLRPGPSVPAALSLDENLSAPGTYTFSYREAPYLAGRAIEQVVEVDEQRSSVEVTAADPEEGTIEVAFTLRFTGVCNQGRECSPSFEGIHFETVLSEGEYPTKERER